MKILFLSASPTLGGAELSLLDMCVSLRMANPAWRLGLVCLGDGELAEAARLQGIEVSILNPSSELSTLGDGFATQPLAQRITGTLSMGPHLLLSISRYVSELRGIIARFQPDVIHSNGPKMHVLSSLAKTGDPKLIWHIRDYIGTRRITRPLLRLLQSRCDMAICNSMSVLEDLERNCGFKRPARVIYNKIDLKSFQPAGPKMDLDAASGLPPAGYDTLRVGLVATFAKWKGHFTFIKAISQSSPSVRGYIVGGPIYQTQSSQHSFEELKAYARDCGVEDRIGFVGHVRNVPSAIRGLDVVVHASDEVEPFGRVIIEAMATGVSVVTTALGGAAELVEDGITALKFKPKDSADLASRCNRLLNSDLRSQIASRGREFARLRFDRAYLADELASAYGVEPSAIAPQPVREACVPVNAMPARVKAGTARSEGLV